MSELFPSGMNFMLSSQYYLTERFKAATCIAVIDESNVPQATLETNWNVFRGRWPLRPYYLFQIEEGCCGNTLNIPTNLQNDINTDPLTNALLIVDGNELQRDNGNITLASDWFNLANCGSLPPNENVLLFVDRSGSLILANVRASYDKFLSDASSAGLNVWLVSNISENYIDPFITWSGDQIQ